MITAAIWIAYAAAWMCASVLSTRWIADNHGRCNGRSVDGTRRLMDGSKAYSRSTCVDWHGRGCWRADGEITPPKFAVAAGASLVWPLLILPAIAFALSTRKPTRIGLENEIARLEREAGIS